MRIMEGGSEVGISKATAGTTEKAHPELLTSFMSGRAIY